MEGDGGTQTVTVALSWMAVDSVQNAFSGVVATMILPFCLHTGGNFVAEIVKCLDTSPGMLLDPGLPIFV